MEMQVNFLSKLVSLRPGSTVQKMISDVMHGKNEGADNVGSGDEDPNSEQNTLGGFAGRVRSTALILSSKILAENNTNLSFLLSTFMFFREVSQVAGHALFALACFLKPFLRCHYISVPCSY